jgi:hypothetical protein
MDAPTVSAGPWLVLGATVGLLLALAVVLAVVAARRRGSDPPAEPAPRDDWVVDDLPGFLDDPAGAPDAGTGHPAPLATAPPPSRTAEFPPEPGDGGRTLLAMALGALLLVGAGATVAALGAADEDPPAADGTSAADGTPADDGTDPTDAGEPSDDAPPTTPPPPGFPALPAAPEPGDPGAGRLADRSVEVGPDGMRAELSFAGVVLERRAVGVTATYPTLRLTAADVPDGPAVAHVELPTFNCLTDEAPADPVAAGCLRTPVEYADLPTPALSVSRTGDGVRISGRFATYLRPNGSAPVWTGRVYPLTVTVVPGRSAGATEGLLELGDDRARLSGDPAVLRTPR